MAESLSETPKGQEGVTILNSDPEKMDERLFANHWGKIQQAQSKVDLALGQKKAALKKFRKDGGEGDILRTAERISKLSPREALEEFNILKHYLSCLNVEFSEQLELFDQAPAKDEAALNLVAFKAGYIAMNEGHDTDENPHENGTKMHNKWLDGHAKAIKDGEEKFTDTEEDENDNTEEETIQ